MTKFYDNNNSQILARTVNFYYFSWHGLAVKKGGLVTKSLRQDGGLGVFRR